MILSRRSNTCSVQLGRDHRCNMQFDPQHVYHDAGNAACLFCIYSDEDGYMLCRQNAEVTDSVPSFSLPSNTACCFLGVYAVCDQWIFSDCFLWCIWTIILQLDDIYHAGCNCWLLHHTINHILNIVSHFGMILMIKTLSIFFHV